MADPGPEGLAHGPQTQFLAALQEIDNRAIVPIIPHREVNIMVVAIALDHDLVSAPSHHRAPAPTIAPIHLIAQTGGDLAQINIPLEGLDLPSLIHPNTPTISFPIARCFSAASHTPHLRNGSNHQHRGASGDSVLQRRNSSTLTRIMRRAASVS